MTAPVTEDEWGSPTLYNGSQPFEPRMFTEADPMGSVLVDSEVDRDVDGGEAARWSDTTYTGRPRRRRAPAHAAPEPAGEAAGIETVSLQAAEAEPTPSDTGTDAAAQENTTRGLMAASGSIAVASLISRITGFVRSILLAAALGVGAVGISYNSGNNLPNMIYELLLGGVLSSVLIPLLVQAQAHDDDEGIAYTQRLLSIATAALAAMTLVAVAAAPLIAAGFAPAGPKRELTSLFATLLLPEIFFYGLGAMFVSVLNIRHSYRAGAWAPVLNNVIMIVTVGVFWALPGPATLDPRSITTPQILVIGIGTTLGIAAQALVLLPALRRSGFTWQWRFRAHPNEVGRMREVGSLAGWVLTYVVVSQIGVTVIQYVGTRNGGFGIFTYADLLFQMPYGILVVSLLTAIMPRMSRAAVRGDNAAVVADLSLSARLSAVALLPVTALLIALAPAMTVTLFAYGETSILGARLIGSSLAWSAFGLFPFAVVMLQLRVFYAMRDGRTPTLINAFMVGTKVTLVLVTNSVYAAPTGTNVNLHPSARAVEWLNIATSMSYVVGAIVGHFVLTRQLGRLGMRRVAATVARVAGASALGGAAAYGIVVVCRSSLGAARFGSWAGLVGGGLLGLAVIAVVIWRLRIPDVQEAVASVRRR
ncbi:murein biosynthesis integral membrane protein MurJ [uncultured Jatrophihabitans sp.]|uniref:murein biosynthesis integral membrane protein MurJ n=1 Tax=uncultured Jatrophihabitans sp. TaxID=1610747 RepID=UPI0035CBAA34